ncbi:hypothetical protein DPMN_053206 [Dreissena polymorpha]|uniref:Uncharacterized protein n=1 Tax=Dreissena polymorpha TaxID=45954 RepID=A0A9D4CM68_DREPO|nr:hypothetical protein DPMN_053206 [Dreissena polymorpha]
MEFVYMYAEHEQNTHDESGREKLNEHQFTDEEHISGDEESEFEEEKRNEFIRFQMEQIERNINAKTNARKYAENEDEEKKMKVEIKTGERSKDTVFTDVFKLKSRDYEVYEQHGKQEYIDDFGDDTINPDDEKATSTWPDEWD